MPSHYLNQCRNIVNWTLGNKLQWNAFQYAVWKMKSILSRLRCVNSLSIRRHYLWLCLHVYLNPFSVSCSRVSSSCAQPITGQVTEVTCPVIGRAQPELTQSKWQKTGPDVAAGVADAPGASFQEVMAKRADLDMQAKMREDPLYAIRWGSYYLSNVRY